MLIVAERINGTRKAIGAAIKARDTAFIRKEALNQVNAGGDYIDVNAGGSSDEAEALKWLVELVQDATDKPLCLDSADPEVIKQVITMCKTPPMINSITLEPRRLEPILSLVAEYGARVIGLCQDEKAMGHTLETKLAFADRLVEKVTGFGINIEDLYIDPLIFPVSTDSKTALASIEAIDRIMTEFPGVHTICGLTNVSYALPARKLVNRNFLVCALSRSLDAAILDPTDDALYAALRSAEMLLGRDDYCMNFISAYRKGRLV